MFDHSYDRCPAIIKKNMMVVAAEKHTCFYCTTYVMREQFVFFGKQCYHKECKQYKFGWIKATTSKICILKPDMHF